LTQSDWLRTLSLANQLLALAPEDVEAKNAARQANQVVRAAELLAIPLNPAPAKPQRECRPLRLELNAGTPGDQAPCPVNPAHFANKPSRPSGQWACEAAVSFHTAASSDGR